MIVWLDECVITAGQLPGVAVAVAVGVAVAVAVAVGVAVPVPVAVAVGVPQPPVPVIDRFAAVTAPVSPPAPSRTVSVHTPFGFATAANAADRFVNGAGTTCPAPPPAVVL